MLGIYFHLRLSPPSPLHMGLQVVASRDSTLEHPHSLADLMANLGATPADANTVKSGIQLLDITC